MHHLHHGCEEEEEEDGDCGSEEDGSVVLGPPLLRCDQRARPVGPTSSVTPAGTRMALGSEAITVCHIRMNAPTTIRVTSRRTMVLLLLLSSTHAQPSLVRS